MREPIILITACNKLEFTAYYENSIVVVQLYNSNMDGITITSNMQQN